jgi:hypothetical protein
MAKKKKNAQVQDYRHDKKRKNKDSTEWKTLRH